MSRDTYNPAKFGDLKSAEEERRRLVAAFRREDELQSKLGHLEAERDRYRGALEQIVKVEAPKIDEGALMAEIAQEALDAVAS